MYIEVFLLDNLLMNLLIVRLAAALLSQRPPLLRQLGAAGVSALLAALAAYLFPWMRNALLRLPLLGIIALAIPARSFRTYLLAAAATLFATLTVGGCALAAAYSMGGGEENGLITGGIALRTLLVSAFAASFLPSAARRILRRRLRNANTARVVLLHRGTLRRFNALVDTGNALYEPVGGLPVAVVKGSGLERFARIPVPVTTASGSAVLYAFSPERMSVDGREVRCLVAVASAGISEEALIPPELCFGDDRG